MKPGRTPRKWQADAAEAIRYALYSPGGPKWRSGVVIAATGCHAPGQKVMRFDGSLVAVEDVRVDDLLMGPDFTPRRVLSLAAGRARMYRVVPESGAPFFVTEDHLLTVFDRRDGQLVNVPAWHAEFHPHLYDLVRARRGQEPERVAFDVWPGGHGKYHGFTVDGDHRYLLDDFTITHNCGKGDLIAGIAVAHALRGGRVVVVVDRENLVNDIAKRTREVARTATWTDPDGKVRSLVDKDGRIRVGVCMADRNELQNNVVVASIQSLSDPRRLEKLGKVSLLITDEAHGATSPSHRAVHAAIGAAFEAWKHVGFTATGFRGDGSEGLGDVFDGEIFTYTIADAIAAGDLVPIEPWAVPTSISIEDVGVGDDGEFNEIELEDLINNDDRNRLAWRQYMERAPGKPALFFALNVKHAHALAEMGRNEFGVNARAVHGPNKKFKLSKRECDDYIAGFRRHPSERKPTDPLVLCSCDLIRVGFDAPEAAAVVLCRPWRSLVAYIQTVGRGTRLLDETAAAVAKVATAAEKRAIIAASRKPKMVFIQLVDDGKGQMTLDTTVNLEKQDAEENAGDGLAVGDHVLRRRHTDWGLGEIVAEIEGDTPMGRRVRVKWPVSKVFPAGEEREHTVRDLARPKKKTEAEEEAEFREPVTVRVEGLQPYPIHFFGERVATGETSPIGWFEHEGTYTVGANATGIGRVKMHVRRGDDGWEVWSLRPPIAARGEEGRDDIATCQRPDCADLRTAVAWAESHLTAHGAVLSPLDAPWRSEPASDKQRGLLRALGLRRDSSAMTAGEASLLIDAYRAFQRVKDVKDPGLANRRAWVRKNFRGGRAKS